MTSSKTPEWCDGNCINDVSTPKAMSICESCSNAEYVMDNMTIFDMFHAIARREKNTGSVQGLNWHQQRAMIQRGILPEPKPVGPIYHSVTFIEFVEENT